MPDPNSDFFSWLTGTPPPIDPSMIPAGRGTPQLAAQVAEPQQAATQPQQTQPQQTKGHKLLQILLGAAQGGLNGIAANAQTYAQTGRNAGFGGGFLGASQIPFLRAQQQQALQQGQANIANLQSEAAMRQKQADMMGQMATVTLPSGQIMQVPMSQVGQYLRGGFGAQVGAEAKRDVANIQAKNKLDAIALQTQILKQQGTHFVPDADQNGQFYHVYNKFGQEIGRADVNVIPQLMTKTADSVQYMDDGNGNILAMPKSTTTKPVLPPGSSNAAQSTPAANGNAPAQGGTKGPRVVAHGKPVSMVVGTDSTGQQVAGTPDELRNAGVAQFTKLDSGEAAKVNTARQLTSPGGLFDLVNKDLDKFKPGELGPLNSRLQEFLAGKWGEGDPRYVALRTHLNGLLGTAMMQAHVGARGGEQIMEHFEDVARAGKMSADTIRAAINAEKEYVDEKAMRPKATAPSGGFSVKAPNGKTYSFDSQEKLNSFKQEAGIR